MQMLKIFTVSFTLLAIFLTGCGSKTQEPQVVEEKLDLEHVKKIEEQEREQEEKAAELLAQEAAVNLEDDEQPSGTGLFGRALTNNKSQEDKRETTISKKDSKDTKLTATIKNIFKKRSEVIKKKSEPKKNEIETLEILEIEPKKEQKVETVKVKKGEQSKDSLPNVDQKKEKKNQMFLPESKLALSSASRLIPCERINKKMSAIYKRLLETKDINIADRNLRDSNNDSLMPVIHFDFDQILIKSDYRRLLRQQGPCVLKALEKRGDMILQIEGHADERGSDEYNLALGHRRANAVSNSIIPYLSNSKLARIFSYGEEFPLVQGSNKKAWGKNRRAEFTLLLKP